MTVAITEHHEIIINGMSPGNLLNFSILLVHGVVRLLLGWHKLTTQVQAEAKRVLAVR